jgi:hypothetical protein
MIDHVPLSLLFGIITSCTGKQHPTRTYPGEESVMLQQLHTQGMQPIVSTITNT